MDVFSRFHWLAPLERKTSSNVRKELQRIYKEHGVPERLQSDNGGEFKKHVKKYCEENKIKMVRCRPYNPKAQGKVERSHRVLRGKIYYDMMSQKKTGVNWVKNLPDYMKCVNNEKREELAWKSPFEIYYGRKNNELLHDGRSYTPNIETVSTAGPTRDNFESQAEQSKTWRKQAKTADERMEKVMLDKHARRNTYKIYHVGDKVFIRIGKKRGKITKSYRVLPGRITKSYNDDTYQVRFRFPNSKSYSIERFRVEDISDCHMKRKENDKKKRRKEYQRSLRVEKTRNDMVSQITDQGFKVKYDPPGDGNCQFSSLSYSLRNFGIRLSAQRLREEIVNYLRSNDISNGIPLELFAGLPWDQYLYAMSNNGEYGDEITLRAFSNIFNIEIDIISTLGNGGRVSILPDNSVAIGTITLGHFAEGQGDHYICLQETRNNLEYNVEDIDDGDEFNQPSIEADYDSVGSKQPQLWNSEIDMSDETENRNNDKVMPIESLETLPLEILEKIFISCLVSSNFEFPTHVCWTFNNMIKALPIFGYFENLGIEHLPRIYVKDHQYIPKAKRNGEITVNVLHLIRSFGSASGLVMELKRIIQSSMWNTAWLILIAEAYGWYIIKNIFWKSRKR